MGKLFIQTGYEESKGADFCINGGTESYFSIASRGGLITGVAGQGEFCTLTNKVSKAGRPADSGAGRIME